MKAKVVVLIAAVTLTGALSGLPAFAQQTDGSFFSYIDYIFQHHPDIQVIRVQMDREDEVEWQEDPLMLHADVAAKADHGKYYWLTGTVPDSERIEYGLGVSKGVGKGTFSVGYLGAYHRGATEVFGTSMGAQFEYPIVGGFKDPVNRTYAHMRDIRKIDLSKDLETVLMMASEHYLDYLGMLLERESLAIGLDLATFEFDKSERGTDLRLYKKSTSTPRKISQREWTRHLDSVDQRIARRGAQLELYSDAGFVRSLDNVELAQIESLLQAVSVPFGEFKGDMREFMSYQKQIEIFEGKLKKSASKAAPKLLANLAIGYNNTEFGRYNTPFQFKDASYSVGVELEMPIGSAAERRAMSQTKAEKKVVDMKMQRYQKHYEIQMKRAKETISDLESQMALTVGDLKKRQDELVAKQKEFDNKIISRGDLIESRYHVSVARMKYYEAMRALIASRLSVLKMQGRLLDVLRLR